MRRKTTLPTKTKYRDLFPSNRTKVPLDTLNESAGAKKTIQIGNIKSKPAQDTVPHPQFGCDLHSSQSPGSDSPILPFELLKTPFFHRTLDSQPMKVYSRRCPRPQDRTAAPASEPGSSSLAPDVPAVLEPIEVAANPEVNRALAADMEVASLALSALGTEHATSTLNKEAFFDR
jgi:hypothetical protein